MNQEIIEKAARAIHAVMMDSYGWPPLDESDATEDWIRNADLYRRMARAALQANY